MKAMLLAAGRGERLRPLTDRVPKALVEVAGVPLIVRHLRALGAAGIDDVVINLGWLGDAIRERLGDGAGYGVRIAYSDERDDVLETGGGILKALPLLGPQPFLVINADIVCDLPLPPPLPGGDELAHLVLVPNPPYRDDGDFGLTDARVVNGPPRPLTFSGIGVYHPALLAGCRPGRFSLVPLLRAAADAGRLGGSEYRGGWFDVGTPQRLEEARRLLLPAAPR